MDEVILDLDSLIPLDGEQFYQLCQENADIKFERNTKGELVELKFIGKDKPSKS